MQEAEIRKKAIPDLPRQNKIVRPHPNRRKLGMVHMPVIPVTAGSIKIG
jgi:hypothetical protein